MRQNLGLFAKMRNTGLIWIWISFVVVIIDQISKLCVLKYLISYQSEPVTAFFNLTLTYNTGAAFSFLNDASGWQNMLFVTLAYVVCGMLIGWLYKMPAQSKWMSIALSLIIGGAAGNAWDRMTLGYVVDFLDFHLGGWHFAIFNIADAAICIGAFMMLLSWRSLPK